MHIILLVLLTAVLLLALWHLLVRVPKLPANAAGSWGTAGRDDPRIALAAMMHAIVVEESGRLSEIKEQQIVSLLMSHLGLEREVAKLCLTGGRRLESGLSGSLNSRLHALVGPIERNCTVEEKKDVVEMLRFIAGGNAERLGSVRDGIGRISATLLHG